MLIIFIEKPHSVRVSLILHVTLTRGIKLPVASRLNDMVLRQLLSDDRESFSSK